MFIGARSRPLTHIGVLELWEADLRRALRIAMSGHVVGVVVQLFDIGIWWSELGSLGIRQSKAKSGVFQIHTFL